MVISLAAQIRCVGRELAMRRQKYPEWVSKGRMDKIDAEHELAAMQAVLDSLKSLEPKQEAMEL